MKPALGSRRFHCFFCRFFCWFVIKRLQMQTPVEILKTNGVSVFSSTLRPDGRPDDADLLVARDTAAQSAQVSRVCGPPTCGVRLRTPIYRSGWAVFSIIAFCRWGRCCIFMIWILTTAFLHCPINRPLKFVAQNLEIKALNCNFVD